jgi:hypothetical protein
VVWNRRFGTTCRPHLLGSRCLSWTAWPLKKGPICSPETSVSNHFTPCNNPEDGRIQFNRGGSLTSRINIDPFLVKCFGLRRVTRTWWAMARCTKFLWGEIGLRERGRSWTTPHHSKKYNFGRWTFKQYLVRCYRLGDRLPARCRSAF